MTYIVGVKLTNAAILCGDSVLTIDRQPKGARPSSSTFGERDDVQPSQWAGEGALKIINLGNSALALSGDFRRARAIVATYAQLLTLGGPPLESFESAVLTHGPYSQGEIGLLLAFTDEGAVRLFEFNRDDNAQITEVPDNEMVYFGSVHPMYWNQTMYWLASILLNVTDDVDGLLVSLLGILQGFGVRDYLVPQGVGGVFAGLILGQDGARWQQDTLYVLTPPAGAFRAVSTCVRDNVLIVHSTLNEATSFFHDSMNGATNEEWHEKWRALVTSQLDHTYYYIVFLGLKYPLLVICHMLHHRATDAVQMESVENGFCLHYSDELNHYIRSEVDPSLVPVGVQPLATHFLPCTPPGMKVEPQWIEVRAPLEE